MDILVAEKNGINTLTSKTGSGYADTDLIQLYANDGTPNGKIARSALFSCALDALGTLLNQGAADLGTSFAKIPALNSGGTLGSATVANLASVLGVQGLNVRCLNIGESDPLVNELNLPHAQSGILIVGCGGGAGLYPGIYSISRAGTVQTVLAGSNITITAEPSKITITKGTETRATALWFYIQN